MKSTPVKTLLTIGEVADHLRVSKSYLYKVAEQRELRHFKIGKRLMFRPADVESFVSSRLVEATG